MLFTSVLSHSSGLQIINLLVTIDVENITVVKVNGTEYKPSAVVEHGLAATVWRCSFDVSECYLVCKRNN